MGLLLKAWRVQNLSDGTLRIGDFRIAPFGEQILEGTELPPDLQAELKRLEDEGKVRVRLLTLTGAEEQG